MNIKKHWTKEVNLTNRFKKAEYCTDGKHICHRKDKLDSMWGMKDISKEDIDEQGIAPCSKCFPRVSVRYKNLIGKKCKNL